MTDRRVVLRARHETAGAHVAHIARIAMLERGAVRRLDALGAFEIDEMVERRPVQAMEFDDDAGGVIAARHRKIRPAEMRTAADRQRQIGDQGQMRHLLDGDVDDGAPPAAQFGRLRRVEAVRLVFQAEGREEVAAHQVVLDLGGFREEIDQVFPAIDVNRAFSSTWTRPPRQRSCPSLRRRPISPQLKP